MKFIQQSQTIKVTNVDNKVQTEKEIRKLRNMLPISIRGIICDSSNYGKTNVLINLLESPWHMFRERVCVLEIIATAKYRYLENLLSPIEENDYSTFSNNHVVPSNEALRNSIFVFDDLACDKQDAIREFVIGRHADVDCSICVRCTQRYRSILYAIMQIC